MKKHIWMNEGGNFVGASGVNTVAEMAELAIAGNDIWVDYITESGHPPTIEGAIKWLTELRVHAMAVPSSTFRKEIWDVTFSIPMDARPGRGYVKVLGAQL